MAEKARKAEAIEKDLLKEGIDIKKLSEAIETYSLPRNGKFTDYQVKTANINGKEVKFVVLITDDGSMISMGQVQRTGHFGEKDKAVLKKIEKEGEWKDKHYLSGKAVNPTLLGNQAKVLETMLDKKFKAVEKEGYVIPFEGNSTDENEVRENLTLKTFYQIKLEE